MSSGVFFMLRIKLKHFSAICPRLFLSRSTRTSPQHLMTSRAWLGEHTPVLSSRRKICSKARIRINNYTNDCDPGPLLTLSSSYSMTLPCLLMARSTLYRSRSRFSLSALTNFSFRHPSSDTSF